ncbi:hypothetical protein CLV71_103363 [Actinophytocola oryzae]|uniref:Tetratricopeptide repeat protein n=1 Tax=Actinophytocola oryzae TaxID=502181 RepID=A0A4R7VYL6_9PSEU|nr:hypothetical protein CLV71_103363 [Actinophytocola oryzae]
MSFSWTDRYDTLSPKAATVLRATALIGSTEPAELVHALDMAKDEITDNLAELRRTGWTRQQSDGRETLVAEAETWLVHDAIDVVPAERLTANDGHIAARYLDHHLARLGHGDHDAVAAWTTTHRDRLIAALRLGLRSGDVQQVLAVAMAASRVASDVPDREWRAALMAVGEQIARRAPANAVDLLRANGDAALRSSDVTTAERQYEHALAIAGEHGEEKVLGDLLAALIPVLLGRGQASRAADALLDLADLHQRAGEQHALADTLARLGGLMVACGRTEQGITYFDQAEQLLCGLRPRDIAFEARVAELRGRALWALGNTTLGRRAFNQALDLLGTKGNEEARERLRQLVRTRRDDDLPRPGTTTG